MSGRRYLQPSNNRLACTGKTYFHVAKVESVRSEAAVEPGRARIELDGLSVRYGPVVAVEDLSFEVAPGEFVSLIGPSGCGKSSALRAIGGLVPPALGQVRVDGVPVRGPLPRSVAYV